jgi:hypothetical protein
MNRLTQVVIALSVVMAVILWFATTWLEQRYVVPSENSGSAELSLGSVRSDSIAKTASESAHCADVESEMRELVDQSRQCSTDSDCAIFDYGYPIECLTSVARNEISSLRTEFSRYHDSCEYRVYYDCPTGESSRRPVCRNRQCEIELTSPDTLQEETLDHLGISD